MIIDQNKVDRERKEIYFEYCIEIKKTLIKDFWNFEEIQIIIKNIENYSKILIEEYEDVKKNTFNITKEQYLRLLKLNKEFNEETKPNLNNYFKSINEYFKYKSKKINKLLKYFTNGENYIGNFLLFIILFYNYIFI
jgi:hypothetical protein